MMHYLSIVYNTTPHLKLRNFVFVKIVYYEARKVKKFERFSETYFYFLSYDLKNLAYLKFLK